MTVTVRAWKTKKGDSLYLDIYHQGKRWPAERLGITLNGDPAADEEKRRIADVVRARRELELLADIHNVIAPHRGSVSLVEYCSGTGNINLDKVLVQVKAFFGMMAIGAITLEIMEEFQAYLVAQKLRTGTIETYLALVIAQLNRAVRSRVIASNPAKGMKRVRGKQGPPDSLTEEEVERLRAAPMPIDSDRAREIRQAFLFCCETGLRWSDVRRLTYGQVRALRITGTDRKAETRYQVEWRQKKTSEPVYVPLSVAARAIIDTGGTPDPTATVFPQLRFSTSPSPVLHRWGRSVGIGRLNFHRSRHTFPRILLNLGVDLATVQKLMGHARIEHTARYAQASDRNKLDAIRRMDGR